MRPNPLLPRTLADETAFPIELLRIALTGEATGRVDGKGRRIGQLDAALTVAQAWTSALPREDRDGTVDFYVGVLTSFLTGKSPHTVRSWSGTVCDFFDFVAHDRLKRGTPDLRLVAPHALMDADVDGYVASLARGRDASPEMIVDPQEKLVAEWLYDAYKKNPARAFLEREIAEEMDAENLSWRTQPPGKVIKGFQGKQTGLRAILSALVRKKVLVRSPTAKEAKAQRHGDGRKKYPYEKARYTRPAGMKPATVATQVQRLTALVNLWTTFNMDAKLDFDEKYRPQKLRKNPWLSKRSELFRKMKKPDSDTADSLRRMYPEDMVSLLSMLHKRATPKGRGVSIRNILAKRDELAVVFLTGTGLRVFEALQADVKNMAPYREGSLWTVSGIRRKMGKDTVTVFVPRLVMEIRDELRSMVYEYVKKATELFSAEWEKSKAEVQERAPGLADEELGRQIEMGMREFSNKHRKEDFFREQFSAYLNLKESGPLLPALGRWGNAMTKARATIQTESGSAVIVPWDENSIRDRLLLMAPKGNPLRQRLHPHAFRHLAVALAEAATPGAMAATALAGHKDSRTTDIYRETASVRAAATLAIEGRLREMLATASGAVAPAPEPGESVFAPPPPVPGVVPPAARPEAEVVVLSPSETTRSLELVTTPVVKEMSIAAELLSMPKALPSPQKRIVRPEDIATEPAAPLAEATAPRKPISVAGTLGVPQEAKAKAPPKKKAPPVSLAATGQEYAVWATTAADWFLPARSVLGKKVIPVNAPEVADIFRKGWLPGPPVVSQWKLHPVLQGALVWTGIRTLLPYRIAMNLKVEKAISWTPEELELRAPEGGRLLSRNAAKTNIPESLIPLPIINFDDQGYLQQLSPMLNMAYDQAYLDDPAAAKAMTRWLIELRSHSARVKKMIELRNKKLGPDQQLKLTWLGTSAEVPVSSWGSPEAVGETRGSVVRNHEPAEIVRFLREQGTTIYGPIGRVSNVEDMKAYDIAMESRLQSNMDSIEDYQEKTSKTGKVRVTQSPRGLHRYKLPAWVTDTDDPIGELSDEDRADLKKWILRAKTARDIVSFDKDSATCAPYWALAFAFASSDERTIVCPESLEGYRRSFAARFKVDPVVACRRAIRHLWEVSEAIRGDKPRGSVKMKPEDIDMIWGVFWSWILPSSSDVKAMLRSAAEEAGKDKAVVDTDHIRFITNRWMDVATVESLVSMLTKSFDAIMQTVLDDQVKIAAREKTAADSERFIEAFIREAAVSLVSALWRTMGGDYDSINEAMVKTLEVFGQRLARPDQSKFARMDKKQFSDTMDAMARPLQESAWSPRGYDDRRTLATRREYLARLGLSDTMAQLTYQEYVESLAKFRASTIAMVSIARLAIYKASALREIVAESVEPTSAAPGVGQTTSIQSVREAAIQSAAKGASMTDMQIQMAATAGLQKASRFADVEEIARSKMGSSLGGEDIQGGSSGGGSLSATKGDDKKVGVVSGAVETYEAAVFQVIDREKAAGKKAGKDAVARYEEIVAPKAPSGGTDMDLAMASGRYVKAMREFLALYKSDFAIDKRTEKAAARLSVKEAEAAKKPPTQAAAYEAAVQRVIAAERARGGDEGKAAAGLYEKSVEPKAKGGGKLYIAAMRKFLAAYNADFDPPMTPNRALTPNLAPLRSSALMEPSLRLLPGIRINPIALILALYA